MATLSYKCMVQQKVAYAYYVCVSAKTEGHTTSQRIGSRRRWVCWLLKAAIYGVATSV